MVARRFLCLYPGRAVAVAGGRVFALSPRLRGGASVLAVAGRGAAGNLGDTHSLANRDAKTGRRPCWSTAAKSTKYRVAGESVSDAFPASFIASRRMEMSPMWLASSSTSLALTMALCSSEIAVGLDEGFVEIVAREKARK